MKPNPSSLLEHLPARPTATKMAFLLTAGGCALMSSSAVRAQAQEPAGGPDLTLRLTTATSVVLNVPAAPAGTNYLLLSGKSEFDDQYRDINSPDASSAVTISDLAPDTIYAFRVSAINASGVPTPGGILHVKTCSGPDAGRLEESVTITLDDLAQPYHELRAGPPPARYRDPHPHSSREAKDLLKATILALRNAGITDGRVIQSTGDAPLSWGTHYGDGYYYADAFLPDPGTQKGSGQTKGYIYGAAFDIRVKKTGNTYLSVNEINATVRRLRAQGLVAWFRKWPGNWHIHGIDPMAPNLKYVNPGYVLRLDKAEQVKYFLRAKDGTAARDKGIERQTKITPSEIEAVKQRLAHKLTYAKKIPRVCEP